MVNAVENTDTISVPKWLQVYKGGMTSMTVPVYREKVISAQGGSKTDYFVMLRTPWNFVS